MKGITYLTDDKNQKVAVQIDLQNYDKALNEFLEELEDILAIELRRNSPTVPWEKIKKRLDNKHKI